MFEKNLNSNINNLKIFSFNFTKEALFVSKNQANIHVTPTRKRNKEFYREIKLCRSDYITIRKIDARFEGNVDDDGRT